MRVILLYSLLLGGIFTVAAQSIERSVLATSGESISKSNAQLDITIGDVVTFTSTNTSTENITQGFNQPIVANGGASISKTQLSDLEIIIYPNPASEVLLVKTANAFTSRTNYKIIDQLGRQIVQGELNPLFSTIDVSSLTKSTYVIMLTNQDGTLNKSIRFTKH
ncbi:MAG: hypothetical protein COA58_13565 [Bacteroidetes bacterium]|nr:MAG: hypothetical protein COA58_13565 [Bacteroidota bacterium]